METIYPGARLAGLNQPGADTYWSSGANFTASEHAGVMMVIATESPQLIRKRTRMLGRSWSPNGPADIFSAYDAALEEGVGPYAFVMREHGLRPFPVWVHRAMALPPQELDHTTIKAHYVHATPTLHGEPAFSFVEFVDEDDEIAHGRIHFLLSMDGAAIREDGGAYEVAFVCKWLPEHEDECTGCMVMRPGAMDDEYTVVELVKVQRTVHMVRSFKDPSRWFLNKWARSPSVLACLSVLRPPVPAKAARSLVNAALPPRDFSVLLAAPYGSCAVANGQPPA
ncbi:unnamed protein product [Closterium sp. Naga37s-1]|nr:unnamed protein product [Closterium sp. Naga37s-1]